MSTTARSDPPVAPPVDVATIAATCDRALAPASADQAELEHLYGLLCGHIRLLLPDAQRAVDDLDDDTLDREIEQVRLTGIGREIERDLAPDAKAQPQVRMLALSCRLLLGYQNRAR